MAQRTCRVGVHGRNNINFETVDYQVIRSAKIETIKMMGQTRTAVFKRLKEENPTLELITRLYDQRFGVDTRPTPEQFAEKQIPIMNALRPYCTKYEVHNEPNHLHRYEGWGQDDDHAHSFNQWFLRTYQLLKNACPWASLGFPGLAIPHRDLEWIEICRPAVERSDWLGVHCYWQTPVGQERNHLTDFWGLRFKAYHEKFPNMIINITECGNSNIQANPPIETSEDDLARQYVEYFQELFKYDYLNSATFFMLSSQDPTWDFFAWRAENGRIKPVVSAVAQMSRLQLTPVQISQLQPKTTTGLLANPIVTNIIDDLVTHPTARFPNRALSQINQIVVHHSTGPDTISPERIAQIHVSRGRPGISYHFFITGEGTAYQTNAMTTVSAHAAGHDQNSLAVCFAGDFTQKIPKPAQLEAGSIVLGLLMNQLNIPLNNIKGASELVATQSPGKQWLEGQQWKNRLLNQIASLPSEKIETPPTTTPATGQITTLNTRIAELTAQLAQAQSANQTANNQIITLNNRLTQLDAEIIELTAQLAQAQSANQTANNQIITLNQRLVQLQTQLNQAQGNTTQVTALNNRIAQLENDLTQARNQAQTGTARATEVAALNTRIAQLEVELAQARSNGATNTTSTSKQPAIQDVVDHLPRHQTSTYPTRNLVEITQVIIHHTAVPASVSAERIAKIHVDRGKPGITYHYYVRNDGTILQTNYDSAVTEHTKGYEQNSLAIAFAGDFTAVVPTDQQLQAGAELLAHLQRQLNIAQDNIKGASELVATQSPGRQWLKEQKWKDQLLTKLGRVLTDSAAMPASAADINNRQIAALQARIAELELHLTIAQIAQEATLNVGDEPINSPSTAVGSIVSQPAIEDIVAELPRHATKGYPTRPITGIKNIIVHHSGLSPAVSARQIADFNVNTDGWPGFGYHYFIGTAGVIQQTNDLTSIAYHAGQHNTSSIGVAFAGNFDDTRPTEAQIAAGAHLIAWLLDHLNMPLTAVHGHKEVASTNCPGNQWDSGLMWRDTLLQTIQNNLAGAGTKGINQAGKTLYHYLLFWQTENDWAQADLANATTYIGKFRPSLGFNIDDAIDAEYVTIVGDLLGVSAEDEAYLRVSGCQVERIAGNNANATKTLLDNLAKQNKRFLTLQG